MKLICNYIFYKIYVMFLGLSKSDSPEIKAWALFSLLLLLNLFTFLFGVLNNIIGNGKLTIYLETSNISYVVVILLILGFNYYHFLFKNKYTVIYRYFEMNTYDNKIALNILLFIFFVFWIFNLIVW
jgi:hypothetical protein